jgi:hypothetical protein
MREAVVKAGIVDEKTLEYSDLNPGGYHALRSSFSRRLEYAGMPVAYFDYMQGHSLPYGGAYRKPNPKKLLDKYREFGHVLEVSETPLTYREVEEKMREELEKRDYLIKGMEGRIKELEKRFEVFSALVDSEQGIGGLAEMLKG